MLLIYEIPKCKQQHMIFPTVDAFSDRAGVQKFFECVRKFRISRQKPLQQGRRWKNIKSLLFLPRAFSTVPCPPPRLMFFFNFFFHFTWSISGEQLHFSSSHAQHPILKRGQSHVVVVYFCWFTHCLRLCPRISSKIDKFWKVFVWWVGKFS